jgi:hypothetical protein
MQITVTIPDELAARAPGLTPESYVEKLVAEQATAPRGYGAGGRLTREEFHASLDRLAQYSDKIPSLPDDAFTRASMYEDHDC